jgi:MinD superfamily P-loop ATPase
LRPGRWYADAVDAFAPYDRIRDPNPELRSDLVRLVETAEQLRIPAYLIVNNRAEGSAPLTIAAVARMLAEKRMADGG